MGSVANQVTRNSEEFWSSIPWGIYPRSFVWHAVHQPVSLTNVDWLLECLS